MDIQWNPFSSGEMCVQGRREAQAHWASRSSTTGSISAQIRKTWLIAGNRIFLSHIKCFASGIWYRLHVKIMNVKLSLVHSDTSVLEHWGWGAGARSTQISPCPLSPGSVQQGEKDSVAGSKLGTAEHLIHCPAARMVYRLGQVLESTGVHIISFLCLSFTTIGVNAVSWHSRREWLSLQTSLGALPCWEGCGSSHRSWGQQGTTSLFQPLAEESMSGCAWSSE